MKSNFLRLVKNKRSMLFIVIIISLLLSDIIIHILSDQIMMDEEGLKYAPSFAAFLSSTTEGHIPQKLLIWFLPIYILLICSDNYIGDVQSGYNNIIIGKVGKATYIKSKLIESFVFPSIIVFLALVLNFLLSLIIFQGGTFWSGLDDYMTMDWIAMSISNAEFTYFAFLINTSIITGLCGLFCTSCAFFFPDFKFAYPIAFILWFFGIVADYSTTYLMQPFAEFDLGVLIPIEAVVFAVTIIVTLAAYTYKVKTDEL